jgi:glucan-binding YG repeat protein
MDESMKRPGWKGKLAIALAAALIAAPAAAAVVPEAGGIAGTEAYAAEAQGQWIQSGSRWWYRNADGTYPANCWKEIDYEWYHFDASDWMQTGWLYDGGSWYYLLPSGKMARDMQDIGGKVYLFDYSGKLACDAMINPSHMITYGYYPYVYSDSEGVLITGWKYVSASDGYPAGWCYFEPASYDSRIGIMRFLWKQIDGTWYYFMPTWPYGGQRSWTHSSDGDGIGAVAGGDYAACGLMATGWQKIGTGYPTEDGKWWWPDGSDLSRGRASIDSNYEDGRIYDDAQWYYFASSGAMQTGWLNDGGTWYWLTGSGAMGTGWQLVNSTWYWFADNGAMQTGWQLVNGSWYYLSGSGAMLHDCWVGNYYLGSSGAMLTNARTPGGCHVGADGAWVPGK